MGFGVSRNLARPAKILAALDARMDEVYWAEYDVHDSGITAATSEYVMSPATVVNQLAAGFSGQRIGVGSGWHYPAMASIPVTSLDMQACVHAGDIASLGEIYWQQGATMTALEARPVYLRDSVAWKKRERIRPVT